MQRNVSNLQKGNGSVTEHYLILVVKDYSCAIGHKTADWVEGKKSSRQKRYSPLRSYHLRQVIFRPTRRILAPV